MTQPNQGCRFPYTMSAKTLTVLVDGNPQMTDRSNPNWSRIVTLLSDPNATADQLLRLMNPIAGVHDALLSTPGAQKVTVKNGAVFWGNESVHNALTQRIMDIVQEGLPLEPWLRFMENVYANPFPAAKVELFEFLEKCNLPITADGCFIAYKLVTADYKDIYTKTFDNSIGKVVEMPREKVDGDRRNLCSSGLHFCSQEYLPHYGIGGGSRVVLVKINPADVVSIPLDYNLSKGRCARYQVVGEVDRQEATKGKAWAPVIVDDDWDAPDDANDSTPSTPVVDFWTIFGNDAKDLADRIEKYTRTVGAWDCTPQNRQYIGYTNEFEALRSALVSQKSKRKEAEEALVAVQHTLHLLEQHLSNPIHKVLKRLEEINNGLVSTFQHSKPETYKKTGADYKRNLNDLLKQFNEARRNPTTKVEDLEKARDLFIRAHKFLTLNLLDAPYKEPKVIATPIKGKAPVLPSPTTPTTQPTTLFLLDGSGSAAQNIHSQRAIGRELEKAGVTLRWFQFAGPGIFKELQNHEVDTFFFSGGTDHYNALSEAIRHANDGDDVIMVTDSEPTLSGRQAYDIEQGKQRKNLDITVIVIGAGTRFWRAQPGIDSVFEYSTTTNVSDFVEVLNDGWHHKPAKVAKKAPAKKAAVKKAAPKAKVDNRPGFETKVGRMTKTRWNQLLKEHKTLAGVAKHLGISQGTLQQYKKRLFG